MLETAPSLCIYSNNKDEQGIQSVNTKVGIEETTSDFTFGDVQQHKEMIEVTANHPMLLRNSADLLQGKEDLQGAEEYYFQAWQANPGDGESLAQYAQLVWELHHDHDRALTYFDAAAQIAPDNSIVMAAYAKFLWETEDDGEDVSAVPDTFQKSAYLHPTDGINVDADDLESYYKRMINDNPFDPTFLKKYAQFLYESKGDLREAEEYYSRAVLVEPQDGEMLSQFATLLWELYHDRERTLHYLERALEAAPQDCNVLAAYARILWTLDDE